VYYYVYDEFVQDPKWERELAAIETRLTDLGIAGKIARLALFRDPTELIRDEIRKGAKTIVAVGNDVTLRRVIDAAAEKPVALAIIPLGKEGNAIADLLGVPSGVAACDTLSARIIEEMDMGLVNGRRFMHSLLIEKAQGTEINCDGQYKISPLRKASLEVRNLSLGDEDVRPAMPTDGRLEVVIRVPERSWFGKATVNASIVPVKKAVIRSDQSIHLVADGEAFESQELQIKVIPRALRIITSKNRKF
jgi:diacylglycerol kinase family enzyme